MTFKLKTKYTVCSTMGRSAWRCSGCYRIVQNIT